MTVRSGPQIRSERVRDHIRAVLADIEGDLERSEGVYAFGKLNKAELVRRTGKSRSVIDKMPEVKIFLERYRSTIVVAEEMQVKGGSDHLRRIAVLEGCVGVLEASVRVQQSHLNRRDAEISSLMAAVLERDAIISELEGMIRSGCPEGSEILKKAFAYLAWAELERPYRK